MRVMALFDGQVSLAERTLSRAGKGALVMQLAIDNDTTPQGSIRKLRPSETGVFCEHLLRLDTESRRFRFTHAVSDSYIEDYASHMNDMGGIVFGYFDDGGMHAAAELRKLGDRWGQKAEAAFSVERANQDLGIGSCLMGRVIQAARNRGVRLVYMSCLADNSRMQKIAQKHEAALKFEYGEVIGEIVPAMPDYFSLVAEAMEDRVGYMLAVFDLQARLVKAA